MRKRIHLIFIFILFILIFHPFHYYNSEATTLYSNDVPSESAILYHVEVNSQSLQSITISPDSNKKEYHVEILNQNQIIIISRYNVDRRLDLRFISNNSYILKISNPLLENLFIDVIISTTLLEKREGDGYYFESLMNWCWTSFISTEQMKIISLSDLKAGNYLAEVAILDDKGIVRFYITDQNPATNAKWYENSFNFRCITFTSREISINKNEDWLVIYSQDDKPHNIIITFTYYPLREFTSIEIVVMVGFFTPVVILLFLGIRRKIIKKKTLEPNEGKNGKEVIRIES
ncbi:MAG: hypothetical protein H7641_08330 [Candidatus Heimdallarchaeota archaeon]|nr:hypothetical protein [Candidatus Heimdallarchaeota archaeon]MCK4877573.1 hypothetical protein [Candidatus Heimdallarchaeota archaeon]